MLGFSSIAEFSTGEFPIVAEIPNLFVQIFSDVSVTKVEPLTTLELSLNYDVDEWKIIYYGGNRNTWTVPLETGVITSFSQKFDFVDTTDLEKTGIDSFQIVYNYPQDDVTLETADESLTSTVFNTSDTYALELDAVTDEIPSWLISDKTELFVEPLTLNWNIFLNIDDPIPLSIEAVQKIKDDDVPSAAWNSRPGLPISPISFNSIGIDLFDGGFTSFPDASEGLLEVTATQLQQNIRNFPTTGELDLSDDATNSTTLNTNDTYELELDSVTSFTQKFNFVDLTLLENGITEQIQAKYNLPQDNIPLEVLDNSLTSTSLNDFSTAIKNLNAATFSKEYTFLQQETVTENIPLQVNIESYEVYVEFVEGGGFTGPVQIWIG